MPLVTTAEIVDTASTGQSGVGAFNVITLEYAQAIVTAADAVDRPVILQVSENAVKFHQGRVRPIAAAIGELARDAKVSVALHLDHVESIDLLHQAADANFSSAMYDGSKLPYADNVAATRAASRWAHQHGLWIEAELGRVGGKEGAHELGVRTDPAEAATFTADTEVDALAVAVGSTHGMRTRTASLDMELIDRLRRQVPVPLVLHGSSGVPDHDLRAAVAHGMVKINVGTALNIAYTGAIRHVLEQSDAPIDPRKYLRPARDAVTETVVRLLQVLT
jgi:fructose-bisphosphate aldolase, class II